MSKENLEQFMEQVAGSEELQAKIGEEIDADSLIALGAECGCEFTAEELQAAAELSDEELDGVAGGAVDIIGKLGIKMEKNSTLRFSSTIKREPNTSGIGLLVVGCDYRDY